MVTDLDRAKHKLKELQERSRIAKEHIKKYKKMSYAEVLQEPENFERLEQDESRQRVAFERAIKRDYPNKLKSHEKMFETYYKAFLKGKAFNVHEYLERLLGCGVGKHEN